MRALKTHCKISQEKNKEPASYLSCMCCQSQKQSHHFLHQEFLFSTLKKKNHKMLTYQSPKSPEVKLTEFTKALKPLSTHSDSQYQYQNHYF